ncbi:hypothetical protein [Lysinibacillus piscis]|nr:hypothetical protein [Lysinibacillus sp. KH24]
MKLEVQLNNDANTKFKYVLTIVYKSNTDNLQNIIIMYDQYQLGTWIIDQNENRSDGFSTHKTVIYTNNKEETNFELTKQSEIPYTIYWNDDHATFVLHNQP